MHTIVVMQVNHVAICDWQWQIMKKDVDANGVILSVKKGLKVRNLSSSNNLNPELLHPHTHPHTDD